ncbi:MAG: hypothetical protein HYW49_07305 [Deltaproteobacteria bacterium]|nr:hypothetical protein [Deltaproteobacteria bacterium]
MSLKVKRNLMEFLREHDTAQKSKFKFSSSLLGDDFIKTPDDTMFEARALATDAWINSEPLVTAYLNEEGAAYLFYISEQMRNKVVLLDVWDFTLLHSIRSLVYVKEWHERYSPAGLVTIGVHAPFFSFGKDKKALSDAVEMLGIHYPVISDGDFAIWKSLDNMAWPRRLLINSKGEIVMDLDEEGGYLEFEREIQKHLRNLSPGLACPPLLKPLYEPDPSGTEVFFGMKQPWKIGNPQRPSQEGEEIIFKNISKGNGAMGVPWLEGKWVTGDESIYPTVSMVQPYLGEFHLAVNVKCRNVYLVAGAKPKNPGELPKLIRLQVLLDEKPVQEDFFGRHLIPSESRKAHLLLREPELHHVLSNLSGQHRLKFLIDNEGYDTVELFGIFFEG